MKTLLRSVILPAHTLPVQSTVTVLVNLRRCRWQYMVPLWSEKRKEEAISFVTASGAALNLGGRVRVAREGFNATVSGTAEGVCPLSC